MGTSQVTACPWRVCGGPVRCDHVEPERGARVLVETSDRGRIEATYLGRTDGRYGVLAVIDFGGEFLREIHPSRIHRLAPPANPSDSDPRTRGER